MELMQKYAKDDGTVGIDNLDRWGTCPAVIDFLSSTTSASSFEELKKVCDLRLIWNCSHWFLAAPPNGNPVVPGRSNWSCMVALISAYFLLILAEIGREELGEQCWPYSVVAYILRSGYATNKKCDLFKLDGGDPNI